MNRDRRNQDRGHVDRRTFTRWELDKSLRWRVFHGRRIRESRMVERSLSGFALQAQMLDAVPAGTRVVVHGDPGEIDKLGFRSAVVRRTEPWSDGGKMLFAEIEA